MGSPRDVRYVADILRARLSGARRVAIFPHDLLEECGSLPTEEPMRVVPPPDPRGFAQLDALWAKSLAARDEERFQ